MHFDCDTLIVGAGPAGCAAAYDLARAGRRVLLLDKRFFPRPKACACGLTRKTLAALRYSAEPVLERDCREIVLQNTSLEPKHREVRVRTLKRICAMAVRERFDHFCLDQTLAAGQKGGSVELRRIESVAALRELSTGIELDILVRNADGSTCSETLRAPVLIGADGSNGQIRRLAAGLELTPGTATFSPEPAWYSRGFALEATVPYSALPPALPAGDAPHDLIFDFSPLPSGYGWLFPKGDHINIGVGAFAPQAESATPSEIPGAPPSTTALSLARVGSENARLKQVTRALLAEYTRTKLGVDLSTAGAQVSGQHLGMGGHAYVPRGRVLLAGDAAGLVDPLTGEGIHSALVSGQAAAAAILETLAPGTASPASPDPAPGESGILEAANLEAQSLAAAFARHLQLLQQTLAFSHRAARAFYRDPERGFRAMRLPILRSLILKTYADGLPHTRLLTTLAKAL